MRTTKPITVSLPPDLRRSLNSAINNALESFRDAISAGVMEQLQRPPYSVNRVLAV